MEFDESKHPRDRFGQFTRKGLEHIKEHPPVGAKSLPKRKFIRFERPNDLSLFGESDKIKNITKQEWALYYKYIADEKYGVFIYHAQNGNRWVRVETKNSCKILIDNNRFQKAKVNNVFAFKNSDDLGDALNYFEEMGVIVNDWQQRKT